MTGRAAISTAHCEFKEGRTDNAFAIRKTDCAGFVWERLPCSYSQFSRDHVVV